jgi:pyrimidine-nucleoside phosphorylase
MRIYDIIQRKRDGAVLEDEEIRFFVGGFTNGSIPDYQMSALLMAIFIKGMDKRELTTLTKAMMESGDTVDLSVFGDMTADKHSTGGVGDKTTLIVAPLVASLGGKVAKMSGRGLGHTGGTVDKLESIPGFQTTLDREEFIRQVAEIGVAVIGQSGHLAPADKRIYALRDVTATVDSIPLIASSIMSKKLASGSKNIVLDVKIGSGAFMKAADDGKKLAETMVEIGKASGRNIAALITNMDIPLGYAVGNSLEVLEAVEVLSGGGPQDLSEVSAALASELLCLCHGWTPEYSGEQVRQALGSGQALKKFREWITRQGGDTAFIEDSGTLGTAAVQHDFRASEDGYISHMDAELIGKAASQLGAGREKSGDAIDYTAGIMLKRKTGDYCGKGDVIAILHTSDEKLVPAAAEQFERALKFSLTSPEEQPLILGTVR